MRLPTLFSLCSALFLALPALAPGACGSGAPGEIPATTPPPPPPPPAAIVSGSGVHGVMVATTPGEPITLLGGQFPCVGQAVSVHFVAQSGTPFLGGTSAEATVDGVVQDEYDLHLVA